MENELFGFFKPVKEEKKELFDFEFVTLIKRVNDKDNYKLHLSKTAKQLFGFEGYPDQKVGIIANLIDNTFKLANLGKTDLTGQAIVNISAKGILSSKELYLALAETFKLDITEDSYLKVIASDDITVNGESVKVIELVALNNQTVDEELEMEDEIASYQEEIDSQNQSNFIEEELPSDEFEGLN